MFSGRLYDLLGRIGWTNDQFDPIQPRHFVIQCGDYLTMATVYCPYIPDLVKNARE